MSRFIDIDMQLGFKKLSVYGSIFYNIEQYTVHLPIHLVTYPGLRFALSGASTGWRSGCEAGKNIGRMGVCVRQS